MGVWFSCAKAQHAPNVTVAKAASNRVFVILILRLIFIRMCGNSRVGISHSCRTSLLKMADKGSELLNAGQGLDALPSGMNRAGAERWTARVQTF